MLAHVTIIQTKVPYSDKGNALSIRGRPLIKGDQSCTAKQLKDFMKEIYHRAKLCDRPCKDFSLCAFWGGGHTHRP